MLRPTRASQIPSKPSIVLVGPPGGGKTYLSSTAPGELMYWVTRRSELDTLTAIGKDPLVMMFGMNTVKPDEEDKLKTVGTIDYQANYNELWEALQWLESKVGTVANPKDAKERSVIIDKMTDFQQVMVEYIIWKDWCNQQRNPRYSPGPLDMTEAIRGWEGWGQVQNCTRRFIILGQRLNVNWVYCMDEGMGESVTDSLERQEKQRRTGQPEQRWTSYVTGRLLSGFREDMPGYVSLWAHLSVEDGAYYADFGKSEVFFAKARLPGLGKEDVTGSTDAIAGWFKALKAAGPQQHTEEQKKEVGEEEDNAA